MEEGKQIDQDKQPDRRADRETNSARKRENRGRRIRDEGERGAETESMWEGTERKSEKQRGKERGRGWQKVVSNIQHFTTRTDTKGA